MTCALTSVFLDGACSCGYRVGWSVAPPLHKQAPVADPRETPRWMVSVCHLATLQALEKAAHVISAVSTKFSIITLGLPSAVAISARSLISYLNSSTAVRDT